VDKCRESFAAPVHASVSSRKMVKRKGNGIILHLPSGLSHSWDSHNLIFRLLKLLTYLLMDIIKVNVEVIFQNLISTKTIKNRCELKGSNPQFRQHTTPTKVAHSKLVAQQRNQSH